MARFTSRSMVGLASVFAGLVLVGACDADEDNPGPPDTGTDSSSGSGGRGGRGGSGGSTGATGGAGGSGGSSGAASCMTAVAVTCDGPEDCPTGQRCCGKWQQVYTEFGCFTSCDAKNGDADPMTAGLWLELCHPGDTCEVSGYMCATSMYLPGSFSRCYSDGQMPDAGLGKGAQQINCGTEVCGTGEKCCLRGAREPYCAAASATCECDPPDAGDSGSDAAPDSGDASHDAAPDAHDAARDAPAG